MKEVKINYMIQGIIGMVTGGVVAIIIELAYNIKLTVWFYGIVSLAAIINIILTWLFYEKTWNVKKMKTDKILYRMPLICMLLGVGLCLIAFFEDYGTKAYLLGLIVASIAYLAFISEYKEYRKILYLQKEIRWI